MSMHIDSAGCVFVMCVWFHAGLCHIVFPLCCLNMYGRTCLGSHRWAAVLLLFYVCFMYEKLPHCWIYDPPLQHTHTTYTHTHLHTHTHPKVHQSLAIICQIDFLLHHWVKGGGWGVRELTQTQVVSLCSVWCWTWTPPPPPSAHLLPPTYIVV